jgi:hypothetical protein
MHHSECSVPLPSGGNAAMFMGGNWSGSGVSALPPHINS